MRSACRRGTQTGADGNSTTYTVTVTPINGFSGVMTFGVSGLPPGVTGSFNPATRPVSGTTTLTITASGSGVPGNYTVTVTGICGGTVHTTSAELTVTASAPRMTKVGQALSPANRGQSPDAPEAAAGFLTTGTI
jgi:hypothetical protein